MKKYYYSIPAFKEYVDKYAKKHGISVDEALEHDLIKNILKHYLAI